MATLPIPQDVDAHPALVGIYEKMIPLEDRKKRVLGNISASNGGRAASAIDEASYAEAARRLTQPKEKKPSTAPGFEGTPMGDFIGERSA